MDSQGFRFAIVLLFFVTYKLANCIASSDPQEVFPMAESDTDDGFGPRPDHTEMLDYMPDDLSDAGQVETGKVKQTSAGNVSFSQCAPIRQDILDRWIGSAISSVTRPQFSMSLDPFSGSHLSYPIFGKPYNLEVNRPPPQIPSEPEPVQAVLARLNKGSFSTIRKRLPDVDWPKSLVLRRERAMLTWRVLVEDVPSSNELGEQLQDAILEFRTPEFIKSIIHDAFHDSSTSTLLKRGADLLGFLRWSRKTYGISAFPVEEKKAYLYVKHMIESRAAPTAPASFKSALAFAGGVIKMVGALEASKSGRIVGSTNQHKLTKRPRKFAKRLTTDMVRILEHATMASVEPEDRIAAGYFCFMLHGRIRKHDLMFAERMFLDLDADSEGYIEAAASRVKTARTTELKLLLMPLLAPVQGLLEKSWAIAWMNERTIQGVDNFKCRLPTVGVDGNFFDHPCDSGTANKWLRKILVDAGLATPEVRDITVHGLKATSLSWLSKFGVPLQDRQLLGRHVPSHMSSALTYSRDEMTEPMRKYEHVLLQIRTGNFNPDESRPKLLPKKPRTVPVQVRVDEATSSFMTLDVQERSDQPCAAEETDKDVQVDSQSDSEPCSSSDSSSSSEAEILEDIPVPYKRSLVELQQVAVAGKLYVCRTSSLLHRRHPREDISEQSSGLVRVLLACGKPLSRSFDKVEPEEAIKFGGCLKCFKPSVLPFV